MKNSAFTLIELLVVVLIIGILSAIALPQYQKAVFKARTAEAAILVKSIYNACEAASLVRGTSCGQDGSVDLSSLDIEIPGEDASWSLGESKNTKYFKYTLQNPGGSAVAYYRGHTGISGSSEGDYSLCVAYDWAENEIICGYRNNDEQAEKLCKSSGLRAEEETSWCW